MIPKVIHHCWFGRGPLPELCSKCVQSWKTYCGDYEIIEWNEDSVDITKAPVYVQQAYNLKKWAFVSDYYRLKIVYENGGVYLDTDVELLKPLDGLLSYNAFFGFENNQINTGLGFGAVAGNEAVKHMMDVYNNILFMDFSGKCDYTPCPVRNTKALVDFGLVPDNSFQVFGNNIAALPTEYLCPRDYRETETKITDKTYSIHHFNASWLRQKKESEHTIQTADLQGKANTVKDDLNIVKSFSQKDRHTSCYQLIKRRFVFARYFRKAVKKTGAGEKRICKYLKKLMTAEPRLFKTIIGDSYRYTGSYSIDSAAHFFCSYALFQWQIGFRLRGSSNDDNRLFGKQLIEKSGYRDRIQIPSNTSIGPGMYLGHGGPIVINPTAVIGNNCNVSHFVTIGSNENKSAVIGNNVYIGPSTCIIENVVIGDNVTIGAGSVVTKNIPENATAAGNYAKVLNFNNPGRYILNKFDEEKFKAFYEKEYELSH